MSEDANGAVAPEASPADAGGAEAGQAAPAESVEGASHENVDKDLALAEGQEDAGAAADPDESVISDFAKFDLGLPENAAVDEETLASFGKQVEALGLTGKQAKALANWQLNAVEEYRQRLVATGKAELEEEWGGKAGQYQKSIMELLAHVNKELGSGEKFSKALERCGALCDADMMRGLKYLASLRTEDALGLQSGASAIERPETPLEALEGIFGKKKS